MTLDHKFYTYVPIALGLLGVFGAVLYGLTLLGWMLVRWRTVLGWRIALSKLAAFLPYVAGVYMVAFLGLYGLYTLTEGFATLTLVRSILFVVLGYKCVFNLWIATELAKEDDDATPTV